VNASLDRMLRAEQHARAALGQMELAAMAYPWKFQPALALLRDAIKQATTDEINAADAARKDGNDHVHEG